MQSCPIDPYPIDMHILRHALHYNATHRYRENALKLPKPRRAEQRVFACPTCAYYSHDELEYRRHWRQTHRNSPQLASMADAVAA